MQTLIMSLAGIAFLLIALLAAAAFGREARTIEMESGKPLKDAASEADMRSLTFDAVVSMGGLVLGVALLLFAR